MLGKDDAEDDCNDDQDDTCGDTNPCDLDKQSDSVRTSNSKLTYPSFSTFPPRLILLV